MPKHLGELPALAAKKFGNREALFFDERSFTFNEINLFVEQKTEKQRYWE